MMKISLLKEKAILLFLLTIMALPNFCLAQASKPLKYFMQAAPAAQGNSLWQ